MEVEDQTASAELARVKAEAAKLESEARKLDAEVRRFRFNNVLDLVQGGLRL